MDCINCDKGRQVVNSHFKLCSICNNERLNKRKETSVPIERIIHSKKQSNRVQMKIDEDEKFYLECFNNSDHKCEECGIQLPTEFHDINGKVIARWRYSHILPKSVYPELRHSVDNINHLCLIHHTQWDHGDKTVMKVYKLNSKKFPNNLIK